MLTADLRRNSFIYYEKRIKLVLKHRSNLCFLETPWVFKLLINTCTQQVSFQNIDKLIKHFSTAAHLMMHFAMFGFSEKLSLDY